MPKFNNIIENMFEIDIKTHCLISLSVKLFMLNMGAHIIFGVIRAALNTSYIFQVNMIFDMNISNLLKIVLSYVKHSDF